MITDADLSFLLVRWRAGTLDVATLALVWRATEEAGKGWARVSTRMATADAPSLADYLGVSHTTALRSLRRLTRHGILHRDGSPPRYAINRLWRSWSWPPGVDVDAIGGDLRRMVGPLPAGSWSTLAESIAADLAERLRASGAAAPPLDTHDLTFRRWCRTIQRLLDEHDEDTVQRTVVFAATDPYWSHRVAGYAADRNVAAVFAALVPANPRPPRRRKTA